MNEMRNTYLLTGLPRAGTTLSCHTLNAYDNTLALHEPLTPSDFDPTLGRAHAIEQVKKFAVESRIKILNEGTALTRQKDGKVPENPVSYEHIKNGLRQMDVSLDEISVSQHISNEHFNLIIKHNALFTALLPELQQEIPVFAIVRNPLSVLASWNSVDLPVNKGRLPAGEMFSARLKVQLDNTPDTIERQLHILEWFCVQYATYLPARIIRYENLIADPAHIGQVLQLPAVYTGEQKPRASRNATYDAALMEMLYQKLIHYGDAIWQFYTREQVNSLMSDIRAMQ